MPAPKLKVVRMLLTLGATVDDDRDHEVYIIDDEDGQRLGWAKVSHGSSGMEIDNGILSSIARTLGLRRKQLNDFLARRKRRDDYVQKIRSGRDLAR